MSELLQILKDWWMAFAAAIGFIVGYIELKFTARSNSKDIARLERDMRDHGDRTSRMFEEIRTDIKTLLGKVK